MPKPFLTLLLCLAASLHAWGQITVRGTVRDRNTNAPLPFCTVAVTGKNQGCLSNEEGQFELRVDTRSDSLRFQYLGYQPLTLAAKALLTQHNVLLDPAEYQLGEIEIFANDTYLYDLTARCRKRLQAARSAAARVYFSLDTEISQRPVEMLECYYNGVVEGSQIKSLDLKAGRIGVAPQRDGRVFVSLNTSEALRLVNLTLGNKQLPDIPLQFSAPKLKKHFTLSRKSSGDSTLQRIEFVPKRPKEGFSGEIWIDKTTADIRKITLAVDSAAIYPFAPFRPRDSFLNVSLEITQEFGPSSGGPQLRYIDFNYGIAYLTRLADGRLDPLPRHIFTTGRMYCYQYGQLFRLPLFRHEANAYPTSTDYGKISDQPYNADFWQHNSGLLYTERQERILHFLQTEGQLLNYQQRIGVRSNEFLMEHNNVQWSATERVWLRKSVVTANSSERYRLAAQIFLDLNEDADSLRHFSATVLDVHHSFFESDNPDAAACFLNIFFDLCEIKRRAMERQLASQPHSAAEITALHTKTTRELEQLAERYVRDTKQGQNRAALKKWNREVWEQLGIDNFKLFRQ